MKMKVQLTLLAVIATVSGVYNPENVSQRPVDRVISCPPGCSCFSEKKLTAQCYFNFSKYNILDMLPWKPMRLRIHGDDSTWKVGKFQQSVRKIIYRGSDTATSDAVVLQEVFSALTGLDLSYIPLTLVSASDFQDLSLLELLNLTNNNISQIASNAFRKLRDLQVLDLNGNQISSLPVDAFDGLENLKELHLRGNGLTTISARHFSALTSLELLDLQSNLLREVESFVHGFQRPLSLNVRGNEIEYISEEAVTSLLANFKSVSFTRNPFWCSCILEKFISAYKTHQTIFEGSLECFAPKELEHMNFIDIDVNTLPCAGANITTLTSDVNVPYQSELVLECCVVGDHPLMTYWLTPWGGKYSYKGLSHSFMQVDGLKSDETFQASNLLVTSQVYVSNSGALHIDRYRGHFSGNFTCIGVNAIGESNRTVYVGITSDIPLTYISSLFIGAYCSSAMLGFAVIIGSVRTFVSKCLHTDKCNCCCCRCDDVELFEEKIKPEDLKVEVEVRCGTLDSHPEDSEFDPDQPIPSTPLNSPEGRSSSEQCSTPCTEELSDQKSQAIWDQLDEVRNRLRCGAERKMEKVRSHVRSITDTGSLKIRNFKDAGSMKIQSIKESGSHAASMVKKNVASGMVQVKYGVQSIKEFCGTGDMGPGTISMVSVTTDVDTKEHKQMVKSHTFV